MDLTLRDFVTKRKAEIRTQLVQLRAELKELRAAEAILTTSASEKLSPVAETVKPHTIKDMILDVLSQRPAGVDAWAIIDMIQQRYNIKVQRYSLSPQLSRLKEAGKVSVENRVWRLTLHERKTPDAQTSRASKHNEQGSDGDVFE